MKAGHRLVADHGTHFEVAPPKGEPFMVAKRGLDKKTVDGIKGLPKVERKDDGGVSGDNQTESATGVSTGNDQAYAPDLTDTSAAPEDDSATNGMTPEQVAMYQKYGISPITAPTDVSATTAPDNTASPATSDQVPMASAANPNTSSIVTGGNQDTSTGGGYGPLAGAYGEAYGQDRTARNRLTRSRPILCARQYRHAVSE